VGAEPDRASLRGPHALNVPVDARASFQTANNRLNWYVEVFVDRKLRSDPTGRLEVVVHRPA